MEAADGIAAAAAAQHRRRALVALLLLLALAVLSLPPLLSIRLAVTSQPLRSSHRADNDNSRCRPGNLGDINSQKPFK